MHRIDGPGYAPGNAFTEGNPAVPTPATVVTADWLNAVQEEIAGVIEGAGDTLDKPDNGQLLAAINTLIAAAVAGFTIADNSVTTAKIADAAVTAAKLAATLDLSGKTITMPANLTPVFTKSFESAEQSVPTVASAVSVAHSLGAVPKMFGVSLRCKTAEHGYAIGDEVDLEMTYASSSTRGGVAFANSTNVGVSMVGSTMILNKTTGAGGYITEANWRLVLRAFA